MINRCVTIIVPIYNVEDYVRECIESIIGQTHKNLQIILVDDGSTDSSGDICDEYGKKDDRIFVIHQKNAGLVEARKSGLAEAIGEYVGFVDGDDYIDADMYEKLSSVMEEQNVDIVHSGYWNEKNGNKYGKVDFAAELIDNYSSRMKLIDNLLRQNTNIEHSICTKLFKRELVVEAYSDVYTQCSYGEDLLCFISAIIKCNRIYTYNKSFYHYRVLSSSISHGMGYDGIEKEIALYHNITDVMRKYGIINIYRESLAFYFGKNIIKHMRNARGQSFIYETYYFDEPELLQNKNIVIYGAGAVGRDYYTQFSRYTHCNVVAWVDKNADNIIYPYIEVLQPLCIYNLEFDYVILAVMDDTTASNVRVTFKAMGIDDNKILWRKPEMYK